MKQRYTYYYSKHETKMHHYVGYALKAWATRDKKDPCAYPMSVVNRAAYKN